MPSPRATNQHSETVAMKLNEKLRTHVRASWRYLLGSLTGLVNRVRSGLGPRFTRPPAK